MVYRTPMSAQPQVSLPAGVVLPSDAELAAELIASELQQQEEEARAREFLEEKLREKMEFCPSV